MRTAIADPRWLLPLAPTASAGLRAALRWGSEHTGLPVIVVAAIALVVSWRIFRRSLRFAVEVTIAVALLLVATRIGWIRW
jgi:hypothetical protein